MAVSVAWNSPAICEAPHVSVIVTMHRVSGLRGHVMQGSAEAVQRRRGAQCTQAGRRLYRGGAGAQCTQQAVTSWQTSQMSTHGSACHTCRRGASFRAYPATFTGPRHPVVQRASLYGAAHSPTPPAAALVQLASSSLRQQQSVPGVFPSLGSLFLSSRETRSRERRRYAKHCPGG